MPKARYVSVASLTFPSELHNGWVEISNFVNRLSLNWRAYANASHKKAECSCWKSLVNIKICLPFPVVFVQMSINRKPPLRLSDYETDAATREISQRSFKSPMADQICYAVLCLFSYIAAGKDNSTITGGSATMLQTASSPAAASNTRREGPGKTTN